MRKQPLTVLVCLLIVASQVGCGDYTRLNPNGAVDNEPPGGIEITDEIDLRERLMAMGHSDTELDWMIDNGISLERIYNEIRFGKFADRINSSQPIGSSGEVILSEYYGGIYYDDEGTLTVIVLEEAFNHAASAIAISEMQELGIIVRTAKFTDSELNATINTLNRIAEDVAAAGASYWYLDTEGNRIVVGLDPYTDEQKAAFIDLLFSASVDPAMIAFKQAVTQEMIDRRAAAIASATQSSGNRIVLVGDVEVSRTGIAFSLENRADTDFSYGEPWDLACFLGGSWMPVPYLPGAGSQVWPDLLYSLQSGGIKQYRQEWVRRFGELSPGRYMFIRDGWLGEWQQNQDIVYALVEFYITEDSPETLSA